MNSGKSLRREYCKYFFAMQLRNTFNFFLCLCIILLFAAYVPIVQDIFVKFSVLIVAIKLAEWLMTATRKKIFFKTVNPKNKSILITGCDSGFGHALAKRMDLLGYKVYAGCLFSDGEGAKELISNCSNNLKVLSLDVTSDESIQNAKKFISEDLDQNTLWAVVNNAGIGHVGEIDWTPLEELLKVYDVNAAGTLRVTKAFLPLIKKSIGRIVNNTSICGRFICPGYVGYCMSKSACVALTTGLRIELNKWGVKAISIEPFFYSTPLTTTEAAWKLFEKGWEAAPKETREEYGGHYKSYYKRCVADFLKRSCNPNVKEVIDCFEDAITAEEPLSTYFPSSLIDKFGIKLLLTLSNTASENYQRTYIEKGVKPAALTK